MSGGRAPLTALEWLRVTHADTLSGRRIEEAIAAERERVLAPIRELITELDDLAAMNDETAASLNSLGARSRHTGLRDAYRYVLHRLAADLPPVEA